MFEGSFKLARYPATYPASFNAIRCFFTTSDRTRLKDSVTAGRPFLAFVAMEGRQHRAAKMWKGLYPFLPIRKDRITLPSLSVRCIRQEYSAQSGMCVSRPCMVAGIRKQG